MIEDRLTVLRRDKAKLTSQIEQLDRDLRKAKDMVGRRVASTRQAAGALGACTKRP